jgi:hypothetical protein
MSLTDLDRFKVACAYPGKLDERAVKRELAAFLWALGVHRRIVRLRACLPILPRPFNLDIEWILAECVNRNKPDLAARDTRDEQVARASAAAVAVGEGRRQSFSSANCQR